MNDESAERLHASARAALDYQEKVKQLQLRGNYCPWVNESAKLCIKKKEELYQIWKRSKLKEDEVKYKLQSNYVVRLLGKLKSDSHKARLRSTVQSQHTWKSGKDILDWPSAGAPTSPCRSPWNCQATGTGTWDLGPGTWDLGPGT